MDPSDLMFPNEKRPKQTLIERNRKVIYTSMHNEWVPSGHCPAV